MPCLHSQTLEPPRPLSELVLLPKKSYFQQEQHSYSLHWHSPPLLTARRSKQWLKRRILAECLFLGNIPRFHTSLEHSILQHCSDL
jgi:hypothetical protein